MKKLSENNVQRYSIIVIILICILSLIIGGIYYSHFYTARKLYVKDPVVIRLLDNMVFVKGGTYMRGATKEQDNDAYDNEKPIHQVTVSDFYIGKYEVTQKEWKTIMSGNNPSYFQGDNRPVEKVNWDDCQKFIHRLNELTGMNFRLPTSAEWEYAARGGIWEYKSKYSGSDTLDNVAWYYDNSNRKTHNVGQKRPNQLGLYDMNGNVWEWCHDYWEVYHDTSLVNPSCAYGLFKEVRGGSWHHIDRHCRVSNRHSYKPEICRNYIGLRLVRIDSPK